MTGTASPYPGGWWGEQAEASRTQSRWKPVSLQQIYWRRQSKEWGFIIIDIKKLSSRKSNQIMGWRVLYLPECLSEISNEFCISPILPYRKCHFLGINCFFVCFKYVNALHCRLLQFRYELDRSADSNFRCGSWNEITQHFREKKSAIPTSAVDYKLITKKLEFFFEFLTRLRYRDIYDLESLAIHAF